MYRFNSPASLKKKIHFILFLQTYRALVLSAVPCHIPKSEMDQWKEAQWATGGVWLPTQITPCRRIVTSSSQTPPVVQEGASLLQVSTYCLGENKKPWSWIPRGLEIKNCCAREGQRQINRSITWTVTVMGLVWGRRQTVRTWARKQNSAWY
jgi:hypothetical protein